MMTSLRHIRAYSIFPVLLLLLVIISGGAVAQDTQAGQSHAIPGLFSDVVIERDEWGIPSVKADNDHDLFMGLGYIMAQDRLWQMDGSRRLAEGRISEVGGREQLHWDIHHRTLRLADTAEKSLELIDPATLELMQAFADGVNAYIETTSNPLPMEFLLMGYEPEPWEVTDSLVIVRLVAAWLGSDEIDESMFGRLKTALGDEIASELFRPVPSVEPMSAVEFEPEIISGENISRSLTAHADITIDPSEIPVLKRDLVRQWLEPLAEISSGRHLEASNIWAVDGSLTESGEPILAMDPHLNYFAPSVLYEVRLEGGSFNCWGATFPGMPFIPFGANEDLAWGSSNLPADCQDLFVEKLNPLDSRQYEIDGEWVDFEIVTEIIKYLPASGDVKDYIYNVYYSVHGPIKEQRFGEYYALKWTGLIPSDDVTQFAVAMRAENIEEFYEAFRNYRSPAQNLCVAETGREGRVAQVIIGDIPLREGYDGRSPADGSDSSLDWVGYIPYDEKPHNIDPPEGYVAHANNIPPGGLTMDGYPAYVMGSSFSSNHRVDRITELLLSGAPLDAEKMKAMQMDDLDGSARIFVPALLEAWDGAGEEFEWIGEYVEMLREWDCHLSIDSVEASLFQLWMIELADSTINSRLPFTSNSYLYFVDRWMQVLEEYVVGESNLEWFADDTTEIIDMNLLVSFSDAVERLKTEVGDDQSEWKWGNLNHAVFPHPSGVEMMSGGSHPWGGGRYTVRVGHFSIGDSLPFENDFGAVLRSVASSVDGEWQIEAVLPPGEGAYTFGPNGTDQMQMWLDGEMRHAGLASQISPTRTIILEPEPTF